MNELIIFIYTILFATTYSLTSVAGNFTYENSVLKFDSDSSNLLFSINVISFKDSNWTSEKIESEIIKANNIFSRCHIQINQANITTLSNMNPTFDNPDILDFSKKIEEDGIRKPNELTIIFAKDTAGNLKALSGLTGGFSYNDRFKENSEINKYFSNLIFILEFTFSDESNTAYGSDLSSLAHELTHVLLKTGHVNYPNLMSNEFNNLKSTLNPIQCDGLKKAVLQTKNEK